MKEVLYLHFGPQCHGYRYMGQQAAALAARLGRPYRKIDVEKQPQYAQAHRVFFPGEIIIGDFKVVYPGTVEQLMQSYHQKGPIAGSHTYVQRPHDRPDTVLQLPEHCTAACGVCIKQADTQGVSEKKQWLKQHSRQYGIPLGLVAQKNGTAVAALEWLPERVIPYPLPHKREQALFITCLYNCPESDFDYRLALLEQTKEFAVVNGYATISIIAGKETPYPNGPVALLEQAGFRTGEKLSRVLLRHKWEEIYWMELLL